MVIYTNVLFMLPVYEKPVPDVTIADEADSTLGKLAYKTCDELERLASHIPQSSLAVELLISIN
jgi:hypothetical protein